METIKKRTLIMNMFKSRSRPTMAETTLFNDVPAFKIGLDLMVDDAVGFNELQS